MQVGKSSTPAKLIKVEDTGIHRIIRAQWSNKDFGEGEVQYFKTGFINVSFNDKQDYTVAEVKTKFQEEIIKSTILPPKTLRIVPSNWHYKVRIKQTKQLKS